VVEEPGARIPLVLLKGHCAPSSLSPVDGQELSNAPAKLLAMLMLPFAALLSWPSRIPTTRFLVPLAARAAWSATLWASSDALGMPKRSLDAHERRTRGWMTTWVEERAVSSAEVAAGISI
jgi:hypothetical protein